MSVDHYENFPVASVLCPPRIRPAVAALYHFARTADDLADEGCATPLQRLAALQRYRAALDQAAGNAPQNDAWPEVFQPLAAAIAQHALPREWMHRLLDAFEQDVDNPAYATRAQLLDYCSRSADPVGRLVLHLAGVTDPLSLRQSDAICSALQLINFWQDLGIDLPRGRCYIADEDLRRHGLDRQQLLAGTAPAEALQTLRCELCAWAAGWMRDGAPLALRVPGRLGWELRLVVQGGWRILERIQAMPPGHWNQRPTLRATDLPRLLWRAARMTGHSTPPSRHP